MYWSRKCHLPPPQPKKAWVMLGLWCCIKANNQIIVINYRPEFNKIKEFVPQSLKQKQTTRVGSVPKYTHHNRVGWCHRFRLCILTRDLNITSSSGLGHGTEGLWYRSPSVSTSQQKSVMTTRYEENLRCAIALLNAVMWYLPQSSHASCPCSWHQIDQLIWQLVGALFNWTSLISLCYRLSCFSYCK